MKGQRSVIKESTQSAWSVLCGVCILVIKTNGVNVPPFYLKNSRGVKALFIILVKLGILLRGEILSSSFVFQCVYFY